MKIYKRVVIRISDGETLYEESEEYTGPITYCGGGGGQAGAVEIPGVIKEVFDVMVNNDRASISQTMEDSMNTAFSGNPFTGVTAYDPSTRIGNWETEVGNFNTLIGALSETTDWAALFAQAVTTVEANLNTPTLNAVTDIASAWIDPTPAAEDEIAADVDAFSGIMSDRISTDVLPRFQRGMQDINAVISSSFVIGQAVIEGMGDRDVAKYQGELRTKAFLQKDQIIATSKLGESQALKEAHLQDDKINALNTELGNRMFVQGVEQMIRYFMTRIDNERAISQLVMEGNKLGIVAEKEESDQQIDIDKLEASWDFEIWGHLANMLAAPTGGSVPVVSGQAKVQSALSGAAAGAALGAVIPGGGATTTAIGAGVGLLGGLLS
jgi:hypothetical protein